MTHGIKINVRTFNTYLIIGLIVVLLLGIYAVQMSKPKAALPKAPQKVSQLTVTVITPPNCDDCFDKGAFAAAVRQLPNTNVTEAYLEYNSTEGKALIEKYALARLPAAVVTGETANVSIPSFKQKDGAYYFDDTPPPYYNVSSKRIAGRIMITYIKDSSCPQCFDITQFSDQLEGVGVSIGAEQVIDASDSGAKAMIAKYGITKLPTMLMSPEALQYPVIVQVWNQVGTQEADGMLVMRNITPPYKDLTDKKVRGHVTITYLVDKACTTCYNASMHSIVLAQSFGMSFKEEKYIDISTKAGQDLIKKYGIKYVPTLLLGKEAEIYSALGEAWKDVGDQAADGTFVFRNVNMLAGITYKDLASNTTNTTQAQ